MPPVLLSADEEIAALFAGYDDPLQVNNTHRNLYCHHHYHYHYHFVIKVNGTHKSPIQSPQERPKIYTETSDI